jgi:gluconate 2-dehydrogenase gamma chain
MSNIKEPGDKIDRRHALHVLAGAVAFPMLSEATMSRQSTADSREREGATHPRFFDRHELQLVDVLSEMIIPADDHSPGAHAAQVAIFEDELISQSSQKTQRLWRQGLAQIELLTDAEYGQPFLTCSRSQQTAIMRLISQNEESPKKLEEEFFAELKRATVDGYYRSAIGIHDDLQYRGNSYVVAFPGCHR